MKNADGLYDALRLKLSDTLSGMRNVSDEALYEMIDEQIKEAEQEYFLPLKKRFSLRTSLFNAFRRLDILQELVDRKDVTEIMVNGKDQVFIEQNGRTERWRS